MAVRPLEESVIRQALDRVLSSDSFTRNERQSEFLKFLVEAHLEGRDAELKESVIGVEVFGRAPGYDPKLDAIVRTEAVRLRARLDKYYAANGSNDSVVIELPKGGYRPAFRTHDSAPHRRINAPTRGWWVAAALMIALFAASGAARWRAHFSTPISVAVLPLENLDRDDDSDYFADGLTDEVIHNLSAIDGIMVRSRAASFAVKGKRLTTADAGRALDADYLVTGSVLHADGKVRVNVELLRARDDFRLWSHRFDFEMHDVLAIQDAISGGIVNTLRVTLHPGRRRYETNLEAYDLYLRGRQIMASFPSQGRPVAKPALDYFAQAITKDPQYALAYAAMADAYLAIERNIATNSVFGRDVLPRAKAAAARALALDPMLSEAQSAMASIHARHYAWADAERGFREAIRLRPTNALAHLELGASVLMMQGRFEEGLAEVRRAVTLDPLSPYVNTELGRVLLLAGRLDEAIDRLRAAIALEPTRNRPYDLLARALSLNGRTEEALAVLADAIARGAQLGHRSSSQACVLAHAGRRSEAVAIIEGLRRTEGKAAASYACLRDAGRALEHLEKALAADEPNLAEIVQGSEFAWLRADARLGRVRQKLNLPS